MLNTRDGFEIARDDFLFDLEEGFSRPEPIELIGEPHIGESGRWCQDAICRNIAYSLVLNEDGDIELHYNGCR